MSRSSARRIGTMAPFKPLLTRSTWVAFGAFGAFAAVLLGAKLWLIGTFGNATPFWDQWDAEAETLYRPFLEGDLHWTDLFALHNEHRIFTTRLLALALLALNGIWNPLLQMVVNAGVHVLALGFGIALLAGIVGHRSMPALLVFSLLLFGVPYAWENTLAAFQSQYYFLLLFSLACLWLTVTRDPLSAPWWGGVVCGTLGFLSLASGVFAFVAAAAVGLMLYTIGLRNTREQMLAVSILVGLFLIGAVLTPSVAGHASLRAASFSQFLSAFAAVLGWPISSNFLSAAVRNLPALSLAAIVLWQRPSANDRRWFLLALVVWSLGQAVSIAYGRADSSLSSRYLDLFAIGILVNFACAISIGQECRGKLRRWTKVAVSAWTVTVLVCLGLNASDRVPAELAAKRDIGLAQERNTRNYLATDDFSHLKDPPFLHTPYPDPDRLASILASPTVRAILPANVTPNLVPTSIASTPVGAFVSGGYYPTTRERGGMTLGSYSAQGDAATGQATIRFDANKRSALLGVPVAGYPRNENIRLEIEQNGQMRTLPVKRNPKESWGTAYIEIERGPFSIILTDQDRGPTGWLAVGAPVVSGRLDALTSALLASFSIFIGLGATAAVLLLTHCALTSQATRPAGE